VGNYRKEKFFHIILTIADYFKNDENYNIYLSNDYKAIFPDKIFPKNVTVSPFNKIKSKADFVFSVGGDGTILSTVKNLKGLAIPVLGIHIGNLGFLAQCTEKSLNDALRNIKLGKYNIEKRIMLSLNIDNGQKYYALNDVVVDHGNSGRVLKSNVYIKNDKKNNFLHLNDFESDGIIISTPTGSTGYSLSSGGPIIHPDLDVLNLTPISSHSLSARPIVFSSEISFKIQFSDKFIDAAITIDGQKRIHLSKENTVYIEKANCFAHLISFPSSNYILTLKNKLGWSGKFSNLDQKISKK